VATGVVLGGRHSHRRGHMNPPSPIDSSSLGTYARGGDMACWKAVIAFVVAAAGLRGLVVAVGLSVCKDMLVKKKNNKLKKKNILWTIFVLSPLHCSAFRRIYMRY
jgi:hypothetical protein